MGYLADLPRPVDAVLVTGDIADHGAAAEDQAARDVLRSATPVLVCPGNHDARAAPGVASTVMLPAERPDGPVLDGDLPASIAFHVVDGERVTTHFRVVG